MTTSLVLARLAADARACRVCVENPIGDRLPHDPNPLFQVSSTARLCIAGQAAGTRAHGSSLPFDDRSGDRLRTWLGIDRDQFYDTEKVAILPMGFCFPGLDSGGSDRPPRKECAPLWRSRFLEAMTQLELVLVIGQYAQAWHLGTDRKATLTETVRNWRRYLTPDRSPPVLPLPHPSWRNNAWLKRNSWFEADLLPVLRTRVRELISNGNI